MKEYDVVVVGGGIAGMLAALAVADARKVAILDANKIAKVTESDKINLVINATSLKVLESMGVGDIMAASSCINKCIISAKSHFGRVRICAQDLGESSLGKTIALDKMRNSLIERLQSHKNITCLSESKLNKISVCDNGMRELYYNASSIKAQVVLAADGHNSMVRSLSNIAVTKEELAYDAVLFYVNMDFDQSIALQRFLAPGSIALVPSRKGVACIIWTLPQHKAKARLNLPSAQLISLAQSDLGKSAGRIISLASKPISYPICMQRASEISLPGVVFLGSVATQFAPITAQGLNLAIRDIAVMRHILARSDSWDRDAVAKYDVLRTEDHKLNYQQIKYLLSLFSNSSTSISILRSFGLGVIGAATPFAKKITNIGFGNADYDFSARLLEV